MAGLRTLAIRWYRKAFGAPDGSDLRDEGFDTVLDGNTAAALSEAAIAGHAVLGGSFPSLDADSVWLAEIANGSTNLFGDRLSAQAAEGPRGIVGAATGLALAGRRATAFLSGPDIAAAQDLLISAAGKHVPLVLHLATRPAAAHGGALGSGHDCVHLSTDAGFLMLFASNVQEVVDFTYIVRRVTEQTLVPGMVIMDGEQTALAAQDASLLSPSQARGYLGAAQQHIASPTAAQALLFGETRRRVPAWHDLDEPVLTGALFEAGGFALGAFARRPYFDDFVAESLAEAFEKFADRTGRRYDTVSRYRLADAKTVLLAQGAAVETARVAADYLRKHHKIRVGVLGIRALRPFPGAAIREALAACENVVILERVDAPLAGEPPLTREVRAALESRQPTCCPVIYGVGGLPLRVADLLALCDGTTGFSSTPRYLGLEFDDTSGEQPKREVLLDVLRRAYPDAASMGIRAATDTYRATQDGSLTIAIRRSGAHAGKSIPGAIGALLHKLKGGRIRSRPAVSWQPWSGEQVDWITHGGDTLHDPGDALHADLTLHLPRGVVVLGSKSKAFRITPGAGADASEPLDEEFLLGGLFGVLTRSGLVDAEPRRVIAAQRRLLEVGGETRGEELAAAFQSGFEQVTEVDVAVAEALAPESSSRWEGAVPAAVRHLERSDDHFASLPRFWDQLGVLHREGMANRLTAGPYLATGTMPPLSSTFSDKSDARLSLPQFEPGLCTGCGKCWTHCPDSAIGVVAAAPAMLIDAGIRKTGAEAVRQVAGKLASRIIATNKTAETVAPTFGQMLDDAYQWLEAKMPLPDERKQAIGKGVHDICEELGELPVAITTPFFHRPEAQKKDSAELLSLAINPDACKDCGICIESCEPGALQARQQDAVSLQHARNLWSVWTATPDTPSATLERITADTDIGTMAAILLSRYCQFAMAGGDPAEAGCGEKMAVRLALGTTEYYQQPLVQRFAKTLLEAGEAISSLLQETLSRTLAVEDLASVTEQLKRTTSPRVDLKTLAEGAGLSTEDHSIDTGYLLRLIDLTNQITAAHHRLVRGQHGLGRARYGLAIAGGSTAAWAGTFPDNPFQAPVLIDMSGDAAQLAAGLIEGHLAETADLVRLLRLARVEIEQPDGADWKREALARLRWDDLSDEELALCPPMLLIGSDEILAAGGLGPLTWLLNSTLPVKVLMLSSLDFGMASEPTARVAQAATNNPRTSTSLLALAQRNAFVAQTSVADPNHLGESVLQALRFAGPALLQVYAPSPTRHGFSSEQTIELAELAVTSRAMPLFRYNPTLEGVFGLRLSLEGNPAPDEIMAPDPRKQRLLTVADWAIGQQRFATLFEPLNDDATTPIAVHEWLSLDASAQQGKTPYVTIGDTGKEQRFAIAPAMLKTARQCLEAWQTLQELAGVVTPFTARLEREIRAEVAAEHRAELDAQKRASEAEIHDIQEKTEAEIASKIRSRLLALASRKRS